MQRYQGRKKGERFYLAGGTSLRRMGVRIGSKCRSTMVASCKAMPN